MNCDTSFTMRQLRGRTLRYLKVACFLLFMVFLIWYTVSALKKKVTPLYASGVVEQRVGDLQYDFSTGIFVYNSGRSTYLQGIVSETLRSTFTVACKSDQNKATSMCLNWVRYAKLEISKTDNCHHVKWTPTSRDFIPHDCFSLRSAHWYGGAELYDQTWPLETADVPKQPYLSNDILFRSNTEKNADRNMFGNVVDRFWINSIGVGIVVNSEVPLFVSINESKSNLLCLSADYTNSPYPNPDGKTPVLEYSVCKEDSISKIHKLLQKKYFHVPLGLPDKSLMEGIVWSTWGRFKPNLTQALLLAHAKNVSDKVAPLQLQSNFIEIDDKYSTRFGDFNFDESAFRNSHQMISYLKEYKFDVIVSMTPFVSVESKSFKSKADLLICDVEERSPSLLRWYSGLMSMVDITKEAASTWYTTQLANMVKDFGIKSFNFHGCESNFLPKIHKTHRLLANPGTFTTEFVSQVSPTAGGLVQVSCGYRSQQFPVYTKSSRKESHWSHKNGLRSVIPSILTLGILGYQFVVPDIIGGTTYSVNRTLTMSKPEPELYIRWMQLTAFMPVMKFAFTPWDYDKDVVEIFNNMMKIRKEKVIPLLLKAMREAEMTGAPIIRPIWWGSPRDENALLVDSEFMVGDSLLVAPILEKGAKERDIYLPEGDWHDQIHDQHEQGKQWLKAHKVKLTEVAYFTRSHVLA
ncbi:myogenesis-regulating glycosidase-like [Argopecten irradians]|uniref:LOW QUALITY PROTEIN: myogenesis-regulating glycosidase-like n=1 Tax=Argopecten irradians TaxID=31199 RepID=UPI00371F218C